MARRWPRRRRRRASEWCWARVSRSSAVHVVLLPAGGHLVELMKEPPEGLVRPLLGERDRGRRRSSSGKADQAQGRSNLRVGLGQGPPAGAEAPGRRAEAHGQGLQPGAVPQGRRLQHRCPDARSTRIDATNDPAFIASLRFVADVGNWDACEWILPAGQSGNPMSEHYDGPAAAVAAGKRDQYPVVAGGGGRRNGGDVEPGAFRGLVIASPPTCTGRLGISGS